MVTLISQLHQARTMAHAYSFIPSPLSPPAPPPREASRVPVVTHPHFMIAGPPRRGAPHVPTVAGDACVVVRHGPPDAHWVALTERTLTMTLQGLCSTGQVHLTNVQACCAGGYYAT